MELAISLISPAKNVNSQQTSINNITEKRPKTSGNICNNKFKVATTPDATTLEYYQSIYTHCKQRFNIPDGIEVVKKSVYQYIENRINNYLFGNYNISEVRSNLYNNLAHYSQLGTEDLNSKTLATYFYELNFNIIKYCEETYSVHNKGKNKLKQYSRTIPNTSTLPKTTANYLQTPEQGTSSKLPLTITPFPKILHHSEVPSDNKKPLQTSSNLLDFLAENQSKHSKTAANEENKPEISEEESIDSENKENKMTTYIAKIPEFNGEDIETSPQEWLDQVTKAGDANEWNAARMLRTIPYFLKGTAGEWFENLAAPFNDWNAFKAAFFEQFTNNNTSITLRNHFRNIKQEPSESVMTYIGKFNKLFRQIHQLKTNDYYFDAQILDQFIAGLKNKLIKKVRPHVPEDLNSVIQHAKRYEMAMEEANRTKLKPAQQPRKKLTNSQRRLKTILPINNNSNPKDEIKITLHHFPITSLRIAITVESLVTGKKIAESYNETNKIGVINITLYHSNLIINHHHQLTIYQDPNTKITIISQPHSQSNINNNRISSNNQLVLRNTTQPKPNYYHTQPSYLTILEEQDFHHTALSEGRAAAQQQQNPFYTLTTIPPARIAKNTNLSDIFPFEFKANKSPFLLSNAAANEQKAITAMYTKAEVKGKTIRLILDSESTRSIIIYQLMQQLKRNTPVGEIDNFLFTLDGITIPVKVLVMDTPQYQALIRNDWLQKANANLNWETQELTISYQGQHTRVPAICGIFNKCSEKAPAFEFEPEEKKPLIETFMALGSTSNWANKTEQEHFTHTLNPKPLDGISLTQNPNQGNNAPIFPLNVRTATRNYCQWEPAFHLKKNMRIILDNTSCLTCGNMLPEECNWIDVAMRGEVCNQTCQYALSISEKVKKRTPFNAVYNSALNKFYHYPHDAKMIFDLAMALINGATKKDVCQIKEAEYIEYTMELAGFNYEDEIEVYHQIASHTYPTQEAQIQQLKQMNIRLCEECIMPCDEHISLPSKNDENEIEFGEPEIMEESKTIPIYLIENQPVLQLKYFNNNGQGIKPEKAHEIDTRYDLKYLGKDTLVLKPKSLTKINLKIAFEIPPEAMVQITSQSSLASKGINVRGGIINAGYTGNITVMLQNETDKPFKIKHAEKIAQAIYLPLINILGLQLVNQREQLGKSNRGTQGFGSTERFTVPVNIALNTQKESHQILRLPQPITISPFGEHLEIYTCPKPTTTQQIFESNEQVCLEHNISIPNIYIPEGTKKVQVTFYNSNNYPIILLNNLEIGVIHSNIFQQELPQTVPNFSKIIGHLLPKINPNPSSKNYHVVMEKLSRINMGQLKPQQQTQLKELIVKFADIFVENNNDLERTDLV
ncbi:hypothetical protein G9A89_005231 [Geosiphon pyriformis]|nr:hypothetical protein G9A89_005231 [Geosiphon pyriformis]